MRFFCYPKFLMQKGFKPRPAMHKKACARVPFSILVYVLGKNNQNCPWLTFESFNKHSLNKEQDFMYKEVVLTLQLSVTWVNSSVPSAITTLNHRLSTLHNPLLQKPVWYKEQTSLLNKNEESKTCTAFPQAHFKLWLLLPRKSGLQTHSTTSIKVLKVA